MEEAQSLEEAFDVLLHLKNKKMGLAEVWFA